MTSLLKWGFRGNVTTVHSYETIILKKTNEETTTLAELIEQKVPLFANGSKFRLKPYLVNGGLQAMYSFSINQQLMYKVWYGREIVSYKQGEKYPHLHDGETTLDFVVKLDLTEEEFKLNYTKTLPEGYPRLHPRTRYMTLEESQLMSEDWLSNGKPIVVIIHGLLGGSHEYHIRGCAENLANNGFNVCVLNSRGCCRSKVTTPHSFTALSTDDVRFFIDQLLDKYPGRKIHCLGFSYGAAVLSNYIGEEGANSKVSSVFVLGCPWDLLDSSYLIHSTHVGGKVMAPMLTKFLVNFMNVQKDILSTNPDLQIEERIAKAKLDKIDKIYQFDNLFTAPLHGFQSLHEYYRRSSPVNQLLNFQTPTLMLNSLDDPVVSTKLPTMDVQLNPFLYLLQTDIGGHFNFIQSDNTLWFIDGVVQWFQLFNDIESTESHYKRLVNDFAYKIGP